MNHVRTGWVVLALASLAILAFALVRPHPNRGVSDVKEIKPAMAPVSAWRAPPPADPVADPKIAGSQLATPQVVGLELPVDPAPVKPNRSTDPPKTKLTQEEIESGHW